jgi:hypothetical protein
LHRIVETQLDRFHAQNFTRRGRFLPARYRDKEIIESLPNPNKKEAYNNVITVLALGGASTMVAFHGSSTQIATPTAERRAFPWYLVVLSNVPMIAVFATSRFPQQPFYGRGFLLMFLRKIVRVFVMYLILHCCLVLITVCQLKTITHETNSYFCPFSKYLYNDIDQ